MVKVSKLGIGLLGLTRRGPSTRPSHHCRALGGFLLPFAGDLFEMPAVDFPTDDRCLDHSRGASTVGAGPRRTAKW